MQICIFEDKGFDLLYPLTYMRPTFELKCGHTLLYEKVLRAFPGAKAQFVVRDWLEGRWKEKLGADKVNNLKAIQGDDTLFINGRLLYVGVKIELNGAEEAGMAGGDVVYARVKKANMAKYGSNVSELVGNLANLSKKDISCTMIKYPWNLVQKNPDAIRDDFAIINKPGVIEGDFHPQACIVGDKKNVYIAKGAKIHPFVCFDVTDGPIIIDEDVVAFPFTRIEGPNAVGKKTQLFGTNLRTGSAIGPVCRVGGEVEDSIIHAYSNKYHDGFLGHAYLCEWVNLGAMTTNSDLKNDYGSVSLYVKGELFDTGDGKVGSFIGDHTKTSIGTLLNTGTIVGMMSNVVGNGGVAPKYIPSFTWFMNDKYFKAQKGLETAKYAMGRRKCAMTAEEEKLINFLKEMCKEEVKAYVRKTTTA
jgi:UDP-N-acetylglucosamine diphosphorylase / glucose-1-phosphate thymidylyltransferase / UDP-N-acetylgalactosamine diphosphorylase / glucosamine-1-phosphate N-acetyltransferase / galactosamine-1-phosphate N-acetyltransferase